MTYFTPALGLAGGSIIGLAAGALLLLSGEILGASGLISSVLLFPQKALTDPSATWKLLFLVAFMMISNLVLSGSFAKDPRLGTDASIAIVGSYGYLIGGLFVGFGTKLGNGCTSGHGICGMARLSKRSFTAVATFMLAAVLTANFTAPDNKKYADFTAFLRTDVAPQLRNQKLGMAVILPLVLASMLSLYNLWKGYQSIKVAPVAEETPKESLRRPLLEGKKVTADDLKALDYSEDEDEQKQDATSAQSSVSEKETKSKTEAKTETKTKTENKDEISVEKKFDAKRRIPNRRERILIEDGVGKVIPGAVAGLLFATGLALSGMVTPSKILGFLNIYLLENGSWDPTLLTVMAGGSLFSWISYQFVEGFGVVSNKYALKSPRGSSTFCIPTNTKVDDHLLIGSSFFGIGWGIAGLCPGPALFLASSGTAPIITYWWPAYIVGAFLAQKLKERR